MNPMRNGPTKIILINAGKYEYAEVELDGAIQIVGRNNSGKTTLINTLQFLYIDERSRMAFGSYTFDQTLDYYFGGEHSYVLFECRTLRGTAVIGWRGASKASGADPERFFYLGPFRREDFLNDQDRIREPKEISALLVDRDFQLLNKAAEYRSVLLSGAGQRNNGLGIVALNDGERFSDFRDTLKNLLNLANISQDQMRERLLMLAGLPTDYIAIDARRILGEDYEQLNRERVEFKQLKLHQDDVQQLIGLFNERQVLWGQLNYRWQDLKTRKQKFDETHGKQIEALDKKIIAASEGAKTAKTSLGLKRDEKERLLQEKSPIEAQLMKLETNKKTYGGFAEQLEQVALDNLERQLNELINRQQEASAETAESVRGQLQAAENRVTATTKSIQHFSRLAVTALREHITDDEISRLFGILNPDLLGLAVGRTGITLSNQKEVVARLRDLISRITDGVYQDDSMTVRLGPQGDVLSKFQNVEALEKELERESKNVTRLTSLLEAVTQRDETKKKIEKLREQKQAQADKLAAYRQFQTDLTSETEWRGKVVNLNAVVKAAAEAITNLETKLENQRNELTNLATEKTSVSNQYGQVLKRYDDCRLALFNVGPRADAEIPDDFDAAVSFYLREHKKESELTHKLETAFAKLGVFADRYKSNDEAETIRNLEQELDALPKREEALQLRWNSHIHGLKGRFQEVLNDLRLIESAKDKLNRELAHVPVSDLKAVKLIVERQAEEISLIERLASVDELNLLDDTAPLDKVLDRVRSKMDRNPVTRIADLFTLGVAVTTADGKTKKYADFHQVESDGTTVTIKVLFNLLVLKSLLHKDDVAIPFFLDEIETLDPANRRAVIQTAKKLGFIAITAAPSAVGEVDACYFLEPDKRGRVVLTDAQRLSLKPKTESQET
jgi:energy-coupling factor transporter ATP-binding protein EcfA2